MSTYMRPFLGPRYQQHPWGPPGPLRYYPPGWEGQPVVFAPSWSTPIVQTLPPSWVTPAMGYEVLRSAQGWLVGQRLGHGGLCPNDVAAAFPGFTVAPYRIGPPVGIRRIPEVYVGNRLRLLLNGNDVVLRVSLG